MANKAVCQQVEYDWLQNRQIITQVYNQEDGLPVVSMTDMVLGADDHLYIASSAGVSRFNGSDFELISTEQFPQLNSNRFLKLYATPDSSIWMEDEQGFISQWKNGAVQTFDSLYKDQAFPEWALRVSHSGHPWISNGKDFLSFNFQKQKFEKRIQLLDKEYFNYTALSDSVLLILTREGLYKYSDEHLSFEIPSKELPFNPKSQETFYHETLFYPLSNHRVAIADSGGLSVYDNEQESYSMYPYGDEIDATPPTVLEVNDSTLLVHALGGHFNLDLKDGSYSQFQGTMGEGIWWTSYNPIWNDKRLYISESSVHYDGQTIYATSNEKRIAQAVHDKEGNLWLTVAGQGLVRITLHPFHVLNAEKGLQSDNTYSIIEDKEQNIWLASFEFGIHRITPDSISYWSERDSTLANNLVWSLYERQNGQIIVGLWDSGLYQFDGKQWKPFLLNGNIQLRQVESFYEDDDGTFWIGSRLGLYKKASQSDTFTQVFDHNGNPLLRVQIIKPGPDGNIWLGTHGQGLQIYDGQHVQPVELEGLSQQPKIRDIYFQSSDTLLIASEAHGLIRVVTGYNNAIQSFDIIDKSDGLPDIGVHRILPDTHGFLWLPSNQGISRINQKALHNYLDNKSPSLWIENFTENDGLPIRETNGGTQSNGMIASDSTIWIPTQKGVIFFDPSDFIDQNPYKHTQIEIVSIGSESSLYKFYGDKKVALEQGERSLIINFSLIHYTNPSNISLEYRIPEISPSWNLLSDDRQLSVTNIPPGSHTIEVRLAGIPAALHQGNQFQVTIPYYFYEQFWFKILVFSGAVFFIGWLFYANNKSAKKREEVLNQRVMERTDLLNQQKNETEKALSTIQQQAWELERLNQVKTDFFINITHELRTPLSLIKGPLSLLKEASNKKQIDREEQLDLIERNSENLNNLVDHLLDLLRMETLDFEKQGQHINFSSFIRNRAAQFQSSEGLSKKAFSVDAPSSQKIVVMADPNSLTLIINNLISNAIKFTDDGDRIEIRVSQKDNQAILEIEDSGIGIHEKDLQHIFDPFFRSENASAQQGSGVGLSIVKRYMERLGGKAEIESKINAGTTVRLIFPSVSKEVRKEDLVEYAETDQMFTDHSAKKIPQADAETAHNETTSPAEKADILVVEDNKDLRLFFLRLLEDSYNVQLAKNGSEALVTLESNTADLIISDVMMPEMGGIEFVQNIRSNKKLQNIPVILLSAKKTNKSISEGLQAGAEVYLTKPIDNRILFAQIDALISREDRLRELKSKKNTKNPTQQAFINEVNEIILRHLSDPNLTSEAIAETMHMSRPTLYRKWKKVSEDSLNEYVQKTRLEEAISHIREKGCTFSEASIVCGFSNPGHFTKVFKKHYGETPSEYFKA
ncbi:hybrid sensor histidine kinase/response regulator transcription factor [Gracilimonas mengyeensis]|nr:hybrid sensor histidine kinase/response regulator transcription factor [Gracilimonas mengyeensis]